MDCDQWLPKTAVLVKTGLYLVLPLMSSVLSFILAELSPTTTHCCGCSFSLQAACMLLSGTSVNHRVETGQSKDIRGKTRGYFLHKYDLIFYNCCFVQRINVRHFVSFLEAMGRGQSDIVLLLPHYIDSYFYYCHYNILHL